MKNIILIITITIFIQNVFACCDGGFVKIYPSGNEVSKNPIFLVEYAERDFELLSKVNDIDIYIEYEDGQKVKLKIIELNKALSTSAQFILKPIRKLSSNKTFSIKVGNLNSKPYFKKNIEYRKWTVTNKRDNKRPSLSSKVETTYHSHFNSSASGHSIQSKIEYTDNNVLTFIHNNQKVKELLVEVTNEEGFKYIVPIRNNSISIYNGMCGSIFLMKQKKNYKYKIQLIDFSGNKSKEIVTFNFRTDKTK